MKMLGNTLRKFHAQVGSVVFSNPFSSQRRQLVRDIAGDAVDRGAEDGAAVAAAIDAALRADDAAGRVRLGQFGADDAARLRPSFLFQIYFRFLADLDRLIERQAAKSDTAADVAFTGALLGQLADRGFGDGEAVRYLGLFYQLRRAYYFIDTALVGESASMHALRFAIWNNVFTHDLTLYDACLWQRMEDFSTLLLGETGTGKGSAAAAIGRSGFIPWLPAEKRFAANFTDCFAAINLSQFAETLIESELFGHRKGAFTGAIEKHEGVFGRASPYGALFLDEIGEVGIPIQIKLLQVLQERCFTPIGSHETRRFSGRVIAATNRPLGELRQRGAFRDDFFYRLCSDVIIVPPLRRRIEESAAELERLVRLLASRMTGSDDGALAGRVLAALQRDLSPDYPWPGNVRELEQAVRRILLTGSYRGDVDPAPAADERAILQLMQAGRADAQSMLAAYCAMLYERLGSYEEVARRTRLDRRTVKKYIDTPKAPPAGAGRLPTG